MFKQTRKPQVGECRRAQICKWPSPLGCLLGKTWCRENLVQGKILVFTNFSKIVKNGGHHGKNWVYREGVSLKFTGSIITKILITPVGKNRTLAGLKNRSLRIKKLLFEATKGKTMRTKQFVPLQ